MAADEYRLVEEVFEVVGEELIALAEYDRDSAVFHYVRGDALDSTTKKQVEWMHEEMILEHLSGEFLERTFELGGLQSVVLGFERGSAYNFIRPDSSGVYVLTTRDYCGGESAIREILEDLAAEAK